MAVENHDFMLFSFDVSKAFAKGMTFEELIALIGVELGEVQLGVPKADLECLGQTKGFENLILAFDILILPKPISGPKDAPRAWRKQCISS